MPFCQWNVNTNCLFKNCFCWSEEYSLHGVCFVFPWRCPPSSIIIYISHYCPTPDSLCHLRHWNNRPWLTFWEAWLLLIGLMADKWLCKKRYGLLQDKKKKKKNRNWILASVSHLICHLFNIDVHYVYGLFGCLLFSGPARPVWSVTRGHGPLIMPFWLMGLIV